MDIGIGLPAGIPHASRDDVLEWARRAERHGFSSLSVIDRLVYGNWDPLIALAAAASVTERIRLTATVLIVPTRNPAILAKQIASLQELADGRLSLGIGIGGRPDDYAAAGVSVEDRGRIMDETLAELERIWAGDPRGVAGPIGPTPSPPPDLLIGGFSAAAYRRVARHGVGWVAAGGGPDALRAGAQRAAAAWQAAGRDGEPRIASIAYFGLGPDAREAADRYLGDYYAFAGRPEHVMPGDLLAHVQPEQLAAGALVDREALRQARDGMAQAGCDELILIPTQRQAEQVGLLAEALLG